MALINFNFESHFLKGNTEIGIILPDLPRTEIPKEFYAKGHKYKVLWLLHGAMGDYSDWVRKSNIELYACENDLVVVMPSALNSRYTSWPNFGNGYDMESFLIDELMPLIYGWFPVSDKREDNFIAGLSMGGMGTLKYVLNYPEKFAAAACFSSSAFDYETLAKEGGFEYERSLNIINRYGSLDNLLASSDNVWDIVKNKTYKDLPPIHFYMGGSDKGFDRFMSFKTMAEEAQFPATFEIIPGYEHEWRFWELVVQKALHEFGFSSRERGNAY